MAVRLSRSHRRILNALARGWFLKSHRDVEGGKVYKLHPLDGPAETVPRAAVDYLCEHGLIDSNKKFPTATYWLTETGKALARSSDDPGQPRVTPGGATG
jgi:hypothetical protein